MVCAWGEWRGKARRSGLLWFMVVGHLLATAAHAQVTLAPGDTREIPLPDRNGTVVLSLEVPPGDYVLALTEYLADTIVEVPGSQGAEKIGSVSSGIARIYWPFASKTADTIPITVRVRNRQSPKATLTAFIVANGRIESAALEAIELEAEVSLMANRLSDDNTQQAILKLESASMAWRRASNVENAARAITAVGSLHYSLGQWDLATEAGSESAALAESMSLPELRGQALSTAGLAAVKARNEDAARSLLTRAQPLLASMPAVNSAESNLCYLELELDNFAVAQACYERLLPIAQKFGDLSRVRRYQNALAGVHAESNRPLESIRYLELTMESARQLDDEENRARTLANIGTQYSRTSRFQDALDAYLRALQVYEALGKRMDQARVIGNIGIAYSKLGDYAQAREFHLREQQLLAGRVTPLLIQAKIRLASAMVKVGEIDEAFALFDDALHLTNSVRLRPATVANWSLLRATAEISAGDTTRGLDALQQLLASDAARHMSKSQTALAHFNIGTALTATGSTDAARQHLTKSLAIRESIYDSLGAAQASAALGLANLRQGRSAEAQTLALQAIARIESMRADIASADLRAVYQSTVSDAYELAVETTMSGDDTRPSEALALAESYRAQTLIDILANNRQTSSTLPKKLRSERERLLAQINFIEDKRLRGREVTDDLPAVINALNVLDKKIGEIDPRFLASDRKQALAPSELQVLLEDGDVVLQYFLGTTNSYVWVVTRNDIDAHRLSDGRRIRRMAKRLHNSLANRGDYQREASALGDLLLASAAEAIERADNVIVIADDALHYTPFEVLTTPASRRPILAGKTVSYLPSMTTLALTRQNPRISSDDSIAVLADPVFDAQDERLASATIAAAMAPSATRSTGPVLNRLKMSSMEASSIENLAGDREVWLRTGTAATADSLNTSAVQQAQIVHIASHGFVDDDVSARTGLALAMLDDSGQPVTGFVGLRQIYNLNLSADLVVLSACDTGLGQNLAGEGLLGLTRGFMYAGAKRVVASLWQVDDRATATLMQYFYEGLLRDGLPPSAALAQAKQRMQREPRWRHPNYWSGFVLLGDWLPLSGG